MANINLIESRDLNGLFSVALASGIGLYLALSLSQAITVTVNSFLPDSDEITIAWISLGISIILTIIILWLIIWWYASSKKSKV